MKDVEGKPSADAWNNIQHKLDHPFEASIQKKVKDITAPSVSSELWTAISGSLSGSFESQIKEKVDTYSGTPPQAIWESIDAKMQSKDAFDQAVAQKVQHSSAAPPANGWRYISKKLDSLIAAKRRRQIATWAALFIWAIIPSSNVMQTWLGDDGTQLASRDEQVQDIPSQPSFSNEDGATPNHGSIENLGNPFSENSHADQLATSNQLEQSGGGDNEPHALEKEKTGHSSTKGSATKSFAQLPFPGNQSLHNSEDQNATNQEFTSTHYAQNNVAIAFQTLNTNSHKGLSLLGFQPKWQLTEGITNPVSEALKKIKRHTQLVMFSMSSGSYQENYKASSDLDDFAQFADSLDAAGWSTSAGASFGFAVSNKFSLTTGLNLTYATKQTNFSVKPIDQPTAPSSSYKTVNFSGGPESLQQANNGRSVYGLVDNETTGTIMPGTDRILHSHYTWVGIPIGARFEQPIGKKFNVSVGLGVEGQLLLNAHTFVPTVDKYGFTEIDPTFANEFYRPNINGTSNIGINYALSDAFGVELGVYHSRALSSISSGKDYISPMPFQSGVRLSVIQRL